MSLERWTESARKLNEDALREALALGQNYVAPEHVFLACLSQPIVRATLEEAYQDSELVSRQLRAALARVLMGRPQNLKVEKAGPGQPTELPPKHTLPGVTAAEAAEAIKLVANAAVRWADRILKEAEREEK